MSDFAEIPPPLFEQVKQSEPEKDAQLQKELIAGYQYFENGALVQG